MITLGSGTIEYLITPPVLTCAAGTSGSIAAGSYVYCATVTTAAGESAAGATTSVTVSANGKVDLTFEWPIGSTGLKIYRKPSAGSYGLVTTLTTVGTATYTDSAASTTAPTPPATSTAWTALGEIDGDCELDLAFESKVFRGQSAFPKAKAFHSGKAAIKAKKVEFLAHSMRNLLGMAYARSGSDDVYSIGQTTRPVMTALRFTHTRSDVAAKTIIIVANNVASEAFNLPFPKEDFSLNDCEFELMADAANAVAAITVQV